MRPGGQSPPSVSRVDFFAPVMALGGRSGGRVAAALAAAILLHTAGAAHAANSNHEIGRFAASVLQNVRERIFDHTVDLVADPPQEPVPEPPPPDPVAEEPAPTPVAPLPKELPTPASPAPQAEPPAAAEAAKVVTAEPDPNEPVDLTDTTFVSGTGERFAGGITAAGGSSKVAVRDPRATGAGVPGGTGTAAKPAAPAPAMDRSRPPRPVGERWDCGFPPEADMEQIDAATVRIVVTVSTDGRAANVAIVKDAPYGFGRLAKQCALRRTYTPALDREGRPVTQSTAPITVTFRRR